MWLQDHSEAIIPIVGAVNVDELIQKLPVAIFGLT